jgi:ABC-type amino acid transport system permease subunit
MLEFGSITVPLVLTYDFHQLYGVSWKQALWKTIVATINLFILYFIIALIIGGLIALIEHFSDAGPILPQINHHVHVGLEPY